MSSDTKKRKKKAGVDPRKIERFGQGFYKKVTPQQIKENELEEKKKHEQKMEQQILNDYIKSFGNSEQNEKENEDYLLKKRKKKIISKPKKEIDKFIEELEREKKYEKVIENDYHDFDYSRREYGDNYRSDYRNDRNSRHNSHGHHHNYHNHHNRHNHRYHHSENSGHSHSYHKFDGYQKDERNFDNSYLQNNPQNSFRTDSNLNLQRNNFHETKENTWNQDQFQYQNLNFENKMKQNNDQRINQKDFNNNYNYNQNYNDNNLYSNNETTAIYVSNLPREVQKIELISLFSPYGKILEVDLNDGFAKMIFTDGKSAKIAAQNLDGKFSFGNFLKVDVINEPTNYMENSIQSIIPEFSNLHLQGKIIGQEDWRWSTQEIKIDSTKMDNEIKQELIEMLQTISAERQKIKEGMEFVLDHPENVEEMIEMIKKSLTIFETPLKLKIARLYLLSDILHNTCSTSILNAPTFRRCIMESLPDIIQNFSDVLQTISGRICAQNFQKKVENVIRSWDEHTLLPESTIEQLLSILNK